MKKKSLIPGLIILTGMMTIISCEKDSGNGNPPHILTASEYLASKEEFSIFSQMLSATDLDQVIDKGVLRIVFAPTDIAVAEFYADLGIQDMSEIPDETLRGILLYHVVNDQLSYWPDGVYVTLSPANNNFLSMIIAYSGNESKINNYASFSGSPIYVKNVTIYPIDKVLFLPTVYDLAAASGSCNIMLEAAEKTRVDEILKGNMPTTLFAPDDGAFWGLFSTLGVSGLDELTAEQLTPILKNHIANGNVRLSGTEEFSLETLNGPVQIYSPHLDLEESYYIGPGSRVITNNLQATNGVLHIIDVAILDEAR